MEGRYGSVGSYLEENGVTRPEIDRVRARIRPKAARDGDREG